MESRYYTIDDIKTLEHCGKDKAYNLAKELPHKFDGKKILVLKEAYEEHYQKEKEKILNNFNKNINENIYMIRKFN